MHDLSHSLHCSSWKGAYFTLKEAATQTRISDKKIINRLYQLRRPRKFIQIEMKSQWAICLQEVGYEKAPNPPN